jgi:hypothetical protein
MRVADRTITTIQQWLLLRKTIAQNDVVGMNCQIAITGASVTSCMGSGEIAGRPPATIQRNLFA